MADQDSARGGRRRPRTRTLVPRDLNPGHGGATPPAEDGRARAVAAWTSPRGGLAALDHHVGLLGAQAPNEPMELP